MEGRLPALMLLLATAAAVLGPVAVMAVSSRTLLLEEPEITGGYCAVNQVRMNSTALSVRLLLLLDAHAAVIVHARVCMHSTDPRGIGMC
jgi:hypothetical protein